MAAPNGIDGQATRRKGRKTMPTIEIRTAPALARRVWRELAQLAIEAVAIGVVFSILLALAVFVVANGSRGGEFAAAGTPAAETRTDSAG